MNIIIILFVTALLGASWIVASRLFRTDSKLSRSDPANIERRFDWLRACRDLAFFFILYVITITILYFGAATITALLDPNPLGFGEGFNKALGSISSDKGTLSPFTIWGALLQLITTLIAVFVSQKVARGRFILDLGLHFYKALPLDVLMGSLLGVILLALITAFGQATGLIVGIQGANFNWGQLAVWLVVFLCSAVGEEIMVRGYIMQTLNQGFGGIVAIVGSSIFWGVVHLLNPNSGIIPAFTITFAGLIFAYAYYITGHLWLPIAFHFSWNFAEGVIFGYPVSGIEVPDAIYRPFVDAPESIYGGRFGPEGGLVGIFVIFLAGVLLYAWSKMRQTPPNK